MTVHTISKTKLNQMKMQFFMWICGLTLGQTQGGGGEASEGARFEASEGHRLCHFLNTHRFHFHPHAAVQF